LSALAVGDSIWIAILASAILAGCYRAVEWRWPERYVGMTSTFGLSAQQTLFRFVAYRAVPTYVFAATAFVTVERIGGSVWISAIAIWTCSIAATHGRVVLDGLLKRRGEVNYASYHVVMIILLTTAVGIAMLTASVWGLLVPAPPELLSAQD